VVSYFDWRPLLAICNGPVSRPATVCEQDCGLLHASVNWRCAVDWPSGHVNSSQPLHRMVVEPTGESIVRVKTWGAAL
jgi:hypothetical protein